MSKRRPQPLTHILHKPQPYLLGRLMLSYCSLSLSPCLTLTQGLAQVSLVPSAPGLLGLCGQCMLRNTTQWRQPSTSVTESKQVEAPRMVLRWPIMIVTLVLPRKSWSNLSFMTSSSVLHIQPLAEDFSFPSSF